MLAEKKKISTTKPKTTNSSTSLEKRKRNETNKNTFPLNKRGAVSNFFSSESPCSHFHTAIEFYPAAIITLPKSLWCSDLSVLVDPVLLANEPVLNVDYSDNPMWASEYSAGLYDSFNSMELQNRPDPHYLSRQTNITADKRARLINVIVSYSFIAFATVLQYLFFLQFKLCMREIPISSPAIFLAIQIVDLFYSRSKALVRHTDMLITGAAAMMVSFILFEPLNSLTESTPQIASKAEDSNRLRFSRFFEPAAAIEKTVTRVSFVALELHILHTIGWRVTGPTVYTYLCRYARAGELDSNTCPVARYRQSNRHFQVPFIVIYI